MNEEGKYLEDEFTQLDTIPNDKECDDSVSISQAEAKRNSDECQNINSTPYNYSIPSIGYYKEDYNKNLNLDQSVCPRCGGKMKMQVVSENLRAGCGTIFLYVLLAMTILGLAIVIPLMLRNKEQTVTYAVCESCGYRKRVY